MRNRKRRYKIGLCALPLLAFAANAQTICYAGISWAEDFVRPGQDRPLVWQVLVRHVCGEAPPAYEPGVLSSARVTWGLGDG